MTHGVTHYGARGVDLQRIAESVGIPVRLRGKTQWVAKSNPVIRAEIAEKLLGRGAVPKGSTIAQVNLWLGEQAATYLGKRGFMPQTIQRCLCEARNAESNAASLRTSLQAALRAASFGMVAGPNHDEQATQSAKVGAHQRNALQWLEMARLAQEMHATELAMKAAGIDTSGADRATLQALEEQLQARRRTAMANLPDMTKPQRKRRK